VSQFQYPGCAKAGQTVNPEVVCMSLTYIEIAKQLSETDRQTDRQTPDRCFTFAATDDAGAASEDFTCTQTDATVS